MWQVQCNWKARPKLRINKSFTHILTAYICASHLAHFLYIAGICECCVIVCVWFWGALDSTAWHNKRKDHQKYISSSVSFKRTSCTRQQQKDHTFHDENRKTFLILFFPRCWCYSENNQTRKRRRNIEREKDSYAMNSHKNMS